MKIPLHQMIKYPPLLPQAAQVLITCWTPRDFKYYRRGETIRLLSRSMANHANKNFKEFIPEGNVKGVILSRNLVPENLDKMKN